MSAAQPAQPAQPAQRLHWRARTPELHRTRGLEDSRATRNMDGSAVYVQASELALMRVMATTRSGVRGPGDLASCVLWACCSRSQTSRADGCTAASPLIRGLTIRSLSFNRYGVWQLFDNCADAVPATCTPRTASSQC